MSIGAQIRRIVRAEHRDCRLWGHSWRCTTASQRGRGIIQGLQCVRCGAERFIAIDARTGARRSKRLAEIRRHLRR
jgi:hypothetical protein